MGYFGESSTKADEYAEDRDSKCHEKDVFAMLLCRTYMGKFYYTTDRNTEAGDKVAAGDYDSTVGDRWKSAGTFREFVIYDNAQVYPEYIVIYDRIHVGFPFQADPPFDIDESIRSHRAL